MSEELGGGIYLDPDFDFEVDSTGDLRTSTDLDELGKDISFNVATELQGELGRRVDTTTQKRINLIVQNELIEDPRIGSINDVTVRQLLPNDGYEVVANCNTVGRTVELIFEVSL